LPPSCRVSTPVAPQSAHVILTVGMPVFSVPAPQARRWPLPFAARALSPTRNHLARPVKRMRCASGGTQWDGAASPSVAKANPRHLNSGCTSRQTRCERLPLVAAMVVEYGHARTPAQRRRDRRADRAVPLDVAPPRSEVHDQESVPAAVRGRDRPHHHRAISASRARDHANRFGPRPSNAPRQLPRLLRIRPGRSVRLPPGQDQGPGADRQAARAGGQVQPAATGGVAWKHARPNC
jgi:hypothetical protein